MNQNDLTRLLEQVRAGKLGIEQAVARLKHLPFEDLGFAKIDHHRTLRQGFAEVVFASGKTPAQVAAIVRGLLRPSGARQSVLVTRANRAVFTAVKRVARAAKFWPLSSAITIERSRVLTGKGSDCFRGHKRYSRGGRSACDKSCDGKSRGGNLRRWRGRAAPPA